MQQISNQKNPSLEAQEVFSWFSPPTFCWEKSGAQPGNPPEFAWQVRGAPAPVRLDLGSSDATVTLSDPSGKPSGRWQRQWGGGSFGRSEKLGKMKKSG